MASEWRVTDLFGRRWRFWLAGPGGFVPGYSRLELVGADDPIRVLLHQAFAHGGRVLNSEIAGALLAIDDAVSGRHASDALPRPGRATLVLSHDLAGEIRDRLYQAIELGRLRFERAKVPPWPFLDQSDLPEAQAPQSLVEEDTTFIAVRLVDGNGEPVPRRAFRVVLPDGTERTGVLSADGTVRIERISPGGTCEVTFPEFDEVDFRKASLLPGERGPNQRGPVTPADSTAAPVDAAVAATPTNGTPVHRARITGMFCETSKSFLLPSAMHGIRGIKTFYDNHPGLSLLVVGHTDSAGNSKYNDTLSLERAAAMAAYLTDDVDEWLKFFGDGVASEKRWGPRELQFMLSALPAGKPPFWVGPPSGVDDARHRAAVRAFQSANGLDVDGDAGPITRREIVRAYMTLPETSLPEGTTLVSHGCGENFPAQQTRGRARSQANRRIEIFFFEGAIDPSPPGPISARGSKEYPAWLSRLDETVDFTVDDAQVETRLASRFPLDLLETLADQLVKNEFAAWSSTIYGSDVPLDAYFALREDLVNRALQPPTIRLVDGDIEGHAAGYKASERTVLVNRALPRRAETDPDAAAELLIALLEEFGHYIDDILRNQYSTVGGDAPEDEGAVFAYSIVGLNHNVTDRTLFARHVRDGVERELLVEYAEFHKAAAEYVNDQEQQDDAKKDGVEFFSAGEGRGGAFAGVSFAHASIEHALSELDPTFYTQDVRREIYFGNWLRDFSQFLDPGWLQYFPDRKKARAVMTRYLALKAKAEFDPTSAPSAAKPQFAVTEAIIGVYRAEEHIDNPSGMAADSKSIDSAFRGPVDPKELEIEETSGLKNYIAARGNGWDTSTAFVDSSLREAVRRFSANPSEGRRFLGQALHTLEDLYAHSNFVELALIRLGHPDVFPWVGPKTKIHIKDARAPLLSFPLVTGTFGMDDTEVSLLASIGEILQKDIECKAGEFSKTSVEILVLLEAAGGGQSAESLFAKVKKLEQDHPKLATLMCEATKIPKDWLRQKVGTRLRELVSETQKQETDFFSHLGDDAKQSNPTHSMLSKDHDDHPLHVIAALCAKSAVAEVGRTIRDAWTGRGATADDVVRSALQFFVHPDLIEMKTSNPPNALMAKIEDFATRNPGTVAQLDYAGCVARFFKQSDEDRKRFLEKAREFYGHNDENATRTEELMSREP